MIAHLKSKYLGLTETFIHSFLSHAKRFKPLVLTDIAQNLDAFPTTCAYLAKNSEINALKHKLGPKYPSFIKNFWENLKYPDCFERLIQEKNVNLMHAHFGTNGYRALSLKRRLKIPLITSFYGIDASQMIQTAYWQERYERLFREGDLFLALGKDMASRLRMAGCPADKICIQHIGIDPEKIPFKLRRWPEENGVVKILYCGRLVEKKGILCALDAFSRVARKWTLLELRIVGDGPLRSVLSRRIRQLKLEKQVILKGALSYPEYLSEIHNAHIFILPSITASSGDMEGTPTVLIEAQASGMPVISTFHADIPEIVLHNQTGYLVPENDKQSLAESLNALLKKPELWAEFGNAGRLQIMRNYNINEEIDKLESIYDKIITLC